MDNKIRNIKLIWIAQNQEFTFPKHTLESCQYSPKQPEIRPFKTLSSKRKFRFLKCPSQGPDLETLSLRARPVSTVHEATERPEDARSMTAAPHNLPSDPGHSVARKEIPETWLQVPRENHCWGFCCLGHLNVSHPSLHFSFLCR